uniref:Uncharacterized protein n=1 Tax=Knipowitschia caucasica TaxID=637954 RepID=A0AAV2L9Q5_KNICA
MSSLFSSCPGTWLSFPSLPFSDATATVNDFCLFTIPSLPALISFSPTRDRLAEPGHSFRGEGSFEGGLASLEALDIPEHAVSKAPLSAGRVSPKGTPACSLSDISVL